MTKRDYLLIFQSLANILFPLAVAFALHALNRTITKLWAAIDDLRERDRTRLQRMIDLSETFTQTMELVMKNFPENKTALVPKEDLN